MTKDEALDLALEFFETMQRYKGTRSNIFIKFEPTATGDYVDLREFDEKAKPIITAIKQARSAQQEPVLQEIEQYRMQMAGISTAAMGYWKDNDGINPDYDTLALRDVAKLYAKYDALYTASQPAPVQPVSGVVLRDGLPTLLQDKHIKETDQRLCILPTTPPAQPAPAHYTAGLEHCNAALEEALVRLQKQYDQLEAKEAAQREFVGLTDEEITELEETTTCLANESWLRNLTHAIEAKLKEKNNG